ncbi:MAG TPA: peptide chain release factor N(5)-glutamine methyltransferase [Anaeromyxobacteraceae bacterium]|nr:peptide chain release factor N(5)-glutamine methyltransferase [Anaeromyxobacteraceae bacterium]
MARSSFMNEAWTPLRLISWTQGYFDRAGVDAPRLTAELLLAHALACDRVRLYLDFDKPLSETELSRFRGLVKRRAEGEPTAYLVGQREFCGRPFHCDGRALIPRPETELLVEAVLEAMPENACVLDLCTGTGCIGISLALARPEARVLASDLSQGALELARENARNLGARLEFAEGDLFEPVPKGSRFHLIVANPPYVPTCELAHLAREVRREPALALDGGPEGLDLARRIVAEAPGRLLPGGSLFLEMHEKHEERLPALCREAGFSTAVVKLDLARLPRFVVACL